MGTGWLTELLVAETHSERSLWILSWLLNIFCYPWLHSFRKISLFSDFVLFLFYIVWLYLPILLLNSLIIFKFLRTFLFFSVWILSPILFLLCGCHFFLNHSLIIPTFRLGLLFKFFSIIISGFSVSSGVLFYYIFILVIPFHVGRFPPCLYTPFSMGGTWLIWLVKSGRIYWECSAELRLFPLRQEHQFHSAHPAIPETWWVSLNVVSLLVQPVTHKCQPHSPTSSLKVVFWTFILFYFLLCLKPRHRRRLLVLGSPQ